MANQNDNVKKEVRKRRNTQSKKTVDKKDEVKKTTKPRKAKIEKTVPLSVVDEKIKEEITKIENEKTEKNTVEKSEITEKKIKFSIFELIISVIIVILIFLLVGYFCGKQKNEKENYSVADKEIQTLIEEYNNILENYYGDIDKEELILGAIKGMLSTLDDYSEVVGEDSNNFEITLEGSYQGVGIGINTDTKGNIIIVTVYPDTPASDADLQPGDIIKKFNGNELTDVTTSEVVEMIGNTNEINLTIIRNEEELEKKLVKREVVLESVYSEMHDDNVGYINVSIFANNTHEQFKNALETLEQQGMKKLIIDLRGNSGGHLSTVEKMLYLFLDSSHIIYQTEDKDKTEKFYSKGTEDKIYPIVILQNSISASASEIMAATLKEELGAYIVGKTSYGKGTVQQLQNVSGVGQYKFTTKKWLTPKGNWINDIGIVPDLDVSLTEEYLKNPSFETDSQYQAAIDYLKNK